MAFTRSTQVLVLGALAAGALSLGGLAAAIAPRADAPSSTLRTAVAVRTDRPVAEPPAAQSPTARSGHPGLEVEALASAGYDATTAVRGTVAYRWPTTAPAEVVRAFDPPEVPWGAGHRGADLALGVGEPVLAAADGVIAFAGTVVDRPVVSILHDDGLRTTYEPIEAVVVAGQQVRAGALLGHLRAGHCPPWQPSCLHWGARSGASAYVDPVALLGESVVRLLPDR